MVGVSRGCLLLADIGGYSTYLAGVELEHSTDILADLLGAVVDQTAGVLQLAKLEGDCAFAYDAHGTATGDDVLAAIDAAYAAFASRRRTMEHMTTCPCDACRRIGQLDLKFVVHHGEWVEQQMAGSTELVGPDVVLAHRLLKNRVIDQTGVRAYGLFTDAAVAGLALDVDALGATRHDDSYDDLGTVQGWVLDVDARWRDAEDRNPVFVNADEAVAGFVIDTVHPPAVVWEHITAADKQRLWVADRVEHVHHTRGSPGVGSTSHCVHGETTLGLEILDWRPYHYYSWRTTIPVFGRVVSTSEITPRAGGGCRVEQRTRLDGGVRQRLLAKAFGGRQRSMVEESAHKLRALLDSLPR